MNRSKLLLVDDNATSLKLLKAVYEAEGYNVLTANEGQEALEVLSIDKIDLIVTDILMPNVDGYYLCYKVRTNDKLKNIPIIIYTATYTSESEEKIALDMGADLFIRKPAKLSVLLSAANEALSTPRHHIQEISCNPESFEMMHQYSSELITKLEQRNIELEQTTSNLAKAEKNYREIFEKANDVIYVHEIKTGRLIEVNQRASEITGYTKEELLSGNPQDFITDNPEFTLQKAIAYIQQAAAGTPQLFEWLSKNKDGSYNWLEVNLKKATIAGEERVLAFYREINDRKKNEEKILKLNETLEQKVAERTAQLEGNILKLKESEEKFQKAFQSSAAGISITRLSDATYLDVNDAFVQMTGYAKEELLNHNAIEIGMIVDFEKREKILEQIRELGSAKHFEIQVRHKSGRILEVLASVETILLNGEKHALNILYDITERKKIEFQLECANKELESFSYSISHDLRTPIRLQIGYCKILEEDHIERLDEEGKRVLHTIQQNALKMNDLIDSMLEFSKIGVRELRKSEIDTEKLVQHILLEVMNSVQHKADTIVHPLNSIYADYNLLRQVWINLISNAFKYSSKKEHPVIEIGCQNEESEMVFYIKDNGSGFDMRYADKLFGVFQRLHNNCDFEGTGIGLSIVKRIITKHDGRIWADAKIDEGATFYFSLPRNRPRLN